MDKHLLVKLLGKAVQERNAFIVYALRVIGALLAFILQIFLARWIGKYEYGIFAYTWACVIILGEVLNFGFYHSIQRLIHEYEVKNEYEYLRGALYGASGIISVASLTVTTLIILALYFTKGSGLLPEAFITPLMIGALSLPAFAFSGYLTAIGQTHGWMTLAYAPNAILRPIMIIAFLLGALAISAGATATTAIGAATLAIWGTMVFSLVMVARNLPEVKRKGPRSYKLKSWMIAALPMMLVSSFELMLFNVDVLMISHYMPPDQTGLYFAATKIMSLVVFLNFAVGSAFASSFALHHAASEDALLKKNIRRAASLTFYPSLCMLIAIFLFKDHILAFFGPAFVGVSYVILPLSIGLAIRAMVGPGERILLMTGQQYGCAIIYIATVLTDIILNIILIPKYGLTGAAIATALSFMQMSILLLWAIRRQLKVFSFTETPKTLWNAIATLRMNEEKA